MSRGVVLLSRDKDLVFQLREELRRGHDVSCSDTLEETIEQLTSTGAQTLLVHLSAETLGDKSPGRFVGELNEVIHGASIVALLDEDCPERLRGLMEKTADHLFDMPANWDELRAVLGTDLDPEEELAGLWMGLPHKELHGHSRSLVTLPLAARSSSRWISIAETNGCARWPAAPCRRI